MKVGDLVRYSQEYASGETTVGIIVKVQVSTRKNEAPYIHAPYRVRWSTSSPTIRSWYMEEELELLSGCS